MAGISLEGTVLGGRFRLEKPMAQGPGVEVYRAFDTSRDRKATVELRSMASLGDEAGLAAFLQASRALGGRLEHPGIPKVIEVGEQAGYAWRVTEAFEGTLLDQFLARRTEALRYDNAAPIVGAILEALEHAHAQGVIHGHLRPANVLLTKKLKPLLLGFGIPGFSGADPGAALYRAPEQFRSELGAEGPGTDVYACGVLLYHLVAGAPPFAPGPVETLAQAHLTARPAALGSRPVLPPAHLEEVVLKALEKHPADRYPGPREMIQALDALTAGRDPGVQLSEFMRRAAPAAPGARGPSEAGSGKLIAVMGAAALALVVGRTVWNQASPASPPPVPPVDASPVPGLPGPPAPPATPTGGPDEDFGDWESLPAIAPGEDFGAPSASPEPEGDEEGDLEGWETPTESWDEEAGPPGTPGTSAGGDLLGLVRRVPFEALMGRLAAEEAAVAARPAAEVERLAEGVLDRVAARLASGQEAGAKAPIDWANRRLGGSSIRAWVLLGRARRLEGDEKGAAWALARAVECVGLVALFPPAAALEDYQKELRVRARQEAALRQAGQSLLRGLQELAAGSLPQALAWLGRCARADGRARGPLSELLLTRARAAMEKKERTRVFPLLKGALNMDPGNARVHQALGDYYLTLALDIEKARYHLRRCLRMVQERRRRAAGG